MEQSHARSLDPTQSGGKTRRQGRRLTGVAISEGAVAGRVPVLGEHHHPERVLAAKRVHPPDAVRRGRRVYATVGYERATVGYERASNM